ncbi:MAG: hypothetical protein WC365_10095 [Candidatus Babeliales bacterium]
MKRRITVEQLSELADEQRQRLREWWKPQEGDLVYRTDVERTAIYHHIGTQGLWLINCRNTIDPSDEELHVTNKANCLPLLDIGQMIGLLYATYESDCHLGYANFAKYFNNGAGITGWCGYYVDGFYSDLCDALWEAVKEAL